MEYDYSECDENCPGCEWGDNCPNHIRVEEISCCAAMRQTGAV
jgi:hypothetical protein